MVTELDVLIYPALLIVDVQNDFCPDGALAVPNGDRVLDPLNKVIRFFVEHRKSIFFSCDQHPENTKHFLKWPPHCVVGTNGAAFAPGRQVPKGAYILSKGTDPDKDGYSAFEGSAFGNLFETLLLDFGITKLYVGGLATDYCVKASCLDARKLGYDVSLLTDACRAVNLKPTDETDALEEMHRAGVVFTTTDDALSEVR